MAERPVFVAKESAPFYKTVNVSFSWNGGFAKVQKQKNITSIHHEFHSLYPGKKVLEISGKSMQEYGKDLSAFSLRKYVPEAGRKIPVENIYQSAKTFRDGGPYPDLLLVSPREAKREERLKNSGPLTGFTFEGRTFPLKPSHIFYDYIYMGALLENEELSKVLLEYDAFTDIEFNPNKSINCQARAAAVFVSLTRMGMREKIGDFNALLALYEGRTGD